VVSDDQPDAREGGRRGRRLAIILNMVGTIVAVLKAPITNHPDTVKAKIAIHESRGTQERLTGLILVMGDFDSHLATPVLTSAELLTAALVPKLPSEFTVVQNECPMTEYRFRASV
jgi:hypothetical protein